MGILIFLIAWTSGVAYVVVGNYLYLAKVLPALSRAVLDGSVKFMPSKQLGQVDLFLARFPPPAPRPWFYGLLAHVRAINVGLIVMALVAIVTVLSWLSLMNSGTGYAARPIDRWRGPSGVG